MMGSWSRWWMAVAAGPLMACGGTGEGGSKIQTVGGQVDVATFPLQIQRVRVIQGTKVVVEAEVGADGRFSLAVPVGKGYRLELTPSSDTPVGMVFPRATGAIERKFDVAGGGPVFELGKVRFIGNPAQQTWRFAASSVPMSSGDGDGECEDGVDPNGAVCVDDDSGDANACGDGEADDDRADGEQSAAEEGGVDCVDGIDAATGAECDGGPAANGEDEADGDGETDDDAESNDAAPTDSAVPEHNLPATVGCADEEGGVDCEDGIDSATGAECDGGPAANGNGDGED